MKTKLTVKLISVLVALSVVICCMSFAFVDVSAVTVNDKATGSAIAGSVVEDDGFTWDNATVYFMLTDRFKNGNTSNDHSYGRTLDKDGKPISGWDTAPGTFHGGDFAGITQAIEEGYFSDLGVNALWISAPYEQTHGYCDSGNGHFAHYSYHGYYVLDYTETDANFGTPEEFETLVDTAHEHGIRVIMDIVMNHCGYNTVADMEEYGFGTLLEGATDFKYVIENVSDFNKHIDYQTSSEDWGKWWGPDWVRSGLPGYTEGGGSNELMSLAGLPDFKTEQTKTVSIPPILKTKWTQEGTYDQKVAKYGDNSGSVSDYLTTWLSEWV
ncbi:MAG: alpha-amylase family glycosyl hydrolase, partial [Ruminococcus bromii]